MSWYNKQFHKQDAIEARINYLHLVEKLTRDMKYAKTSYDIAFIRRYIDAAQLTIKDIENLIKTL